MQRDAVFPIPGVRQVTGGRILPGGGRAPPGGALVGLQYLPQCRICRSAASTAVPPGSPAASESRSVLSALAQMQRQALQQSQTVRVRDGPVEYELDAHGLRWGAASVSPPRRSRRRLPAPMQQSWGAMPCRRPCRCRWLPRVPLPKPLPLPWPMPLGRDTAGRTASERNAATGVGHVPTTLW
eukprot:gene4963-biopygen8557